MPPTKRKAPLRRQVLDLKGEDSSSRSTWQTKYQNIQSEDSIRQNGDSIVGSSDNTSYPADTTKTNPLSGLVGSYNSDSDNEESSEAKEDSLDAKVEDFLKEIQSLSSSSNTTTSAPSSSSQSQSQSEKSEPSLLSKWQQCYDHNSGYPYYWNIETNEVTWEMPPGFEFNVANVANKLNQNVQSQQQQFLEASSLKEKKETKKKVVCKYPWENGSDSEDEKIEMITSFGPKSGDEDSEEEKSTAKSKSQKSKDTGTSSMVGPQLPPDSILAQYKKGMSESDDTEVESLNDSSYETSCLLTYRVQDTGPPGDDWFIANNETNTESEARSNVDISSSVCREIADNSSKKDSESIDVFKSNAPFHSTPEGHIVRESTEKITNESPSRDKHEKLDLNSVVGPKKHQENILEHPGFDFADNVIAEIEKEMPPDYSTLNPKIEEKPTEVPATDISSDNSIKVATNAKASSISGIALLANYEDDSEPEEGNINEKRKGRDNKVNEKLTEKVIKPLFPCMEADAELHLKEPPALEKKTVDCETGNIYESDVNLSDSSIMHKAFKRKKRIEFATVGFGSSASLEQKTTGPENSRILTSTQYNMDPTSNDHRGFGFAAATSVESNKSKNNAGWIQFVKTETINLNQDLEPKQKTELRTEGKQQGSEEDVITVEQIEDAALLLKEKVTFLTDGKEEISPIQHIALQLETLLIAWQQGALSNMYFCRWVKDKCSALIRHEKSAAPTGWTCLWDRKSKRYFYRNVATKVIQWDYPTPENEAQVSSTVNSKPTKEGDPEGGGEEMELCLTPPHSSAAEDKVNNDLVSTSPASTVPDTARAEESSLTSPVTSNSTLTNSERFRNTKSKNKKEITVSEDDADSKSTSTGTQSTSTECEEKEAPPLPPMPPPPPPEEPPPPPPGSPPPMPLNHDQPLPPGVDEPEYGLFRRLSPRQSLLKNQVDASSYSTDVIMTYGYALQVQSNAPSVAAISLQPVDYHGYVHDHLNTNHYVMQSAPSSHVIHCPAKKSKLSLSSELDSFYSDIAMLDNDFTAEKLPSSSVDTLVVQEPNSSAPVKSTQPVQRPAPSSSLSTSVTTIKHTESASSNGVAVKKKKKTKLTPGLSMKKKGVSSLVAKWQQVQQEVRRDLNSGDEEDENTSSTVK